MTTGIPSHGSIDSSVDVPWRHRKVTNGRVTLAALIIGAGQILGFVRSEIIDNNRQADRATEVDDDCHRNNRETRGTIDAARAALNDANERKLIAQFEVDNPTDVSEFPGYADAPEFFREFIGEVVRLGVVRSERDLAVANDDVARLQVRYNRLVAGGPYKDCDGDGEISQDDFGGPFVVVPPASVPLGVTTTR